MVINLADLRQNQFSEHARTENAVPRTLVLENTRQVTSGDIWGVNIWGQVFI
jgi:hypothetical protein